MRGALVLAGLAACYRPAPDRCSVTFDNPTCTDGAVGDGPIDMPIDAAPACPLPFPTATNDKPLYAGQWLAAQLAGDRFALMAVENDDGTGTPRGSVTGTQDDVLSPAPSFKIVIQGDSLVEYFSPRLSYDGLELFVRSDSVAGTHAIMHATRTPGMATWSSPALLDLLDEGGSPLPVQAGTDPTPPTQTIPRRMLLVYGTGGFDELVEQAGQTGQWKRVRTHLEAFSSAFGGQAQLSPDGLQLIYVSMAAGPGILNVVTRTGLDMEFDMAAVQIPTSSSAFRPFVEPDCKHLFYDDGGMVHVVTY